MPSGIYMVQPQRDCVPVISCVKIMLLPDDLINS